MNFLRTTKSQSAWWKQRKIDWHKSYQNWEHPHRFLISQVLKSLSWLSLIEVGCGGGANLMNILKALPGKQVGGVDINSDAIDLCNKTFRDGVFKVNSADNVMLSDKATDIVLSDAVLIYVSPKDIKRYIKEIKRIGRRYLVLCEFHSTSWWNRLALKINSGYNAYDWKKLLESEGFYDVALYKIPKEVWSGTPWEEFGYICVATIPHR